MKKIISLTVISFLFLQVYSQPPWRQRANFLGGGRSSAVGFGISNTGYIGLGYDVNNYKGNLWRFEPDSNWWISIPNIGGPNQSGIERNMSASFSIGTKAYVTTGSGGAAYMRDTWEYEKQTDTWTQKADFGGTARRGATAFSIDSVGYVGTGQDLGGYRKDFYKFSPASNTWTAITSFGGTKRRLAVSFTASGKAYVATGDDGVIVKDMWEYTPQTDTWVQKAAFAGSPRQNAIAFSLNNEGYIGTGYDDSFTFKSDIWKYSPVNDQWTAQQSFPAGARAAAAVFTINGVAYIGTGYCDTAIFYDIWEFNPNAVPLKMNTTSTEKITASVYPNPIHTTGVYRIESSSTIQGKLIVYNSNGAIVRALPLLNNQCIIDRKNMDAGIYYYRVENSSTKNLMGKIIITD